MCEHGISYLKAVGIRVHTVRYRKIRKRVDKQINEDQSDHLVQETWQSSKEYKRNKGASHVSKTVFQLLLSPLSYTFRGINNLLQLRKREERIHLVRW